MVFYCSIMSILLASTEIIWIEENWTITNHMKSNISKCQILLLGKGNPGYIYKKGKSFYLSFMVSLQKNKYE